MVCAVLFRKAPPRFPMGAFPLPQTARADASKARALGKKAKKKKKSSNCGNATVLTETFDQLLLVSLGVHPRNRQQGRRDLLEELADELCFRGNQTDDRCAPKRVSEETGRRP